MNPKLLSRDKFRESVFKRDGGKCVICGAPGRDAHHILERRLFTGPEEKEGYFIDNGATVCEPCHIKCEQTSISVEEVRAAAGITKIILPSHLYDEVYDKWGNIILPNDQRVKGELFYDESVQKILAGVLDKFTNRVKYPRTHHLPWSAGIHDDDRIIESMDQFLDKEVVVMEKLDGENTTLYHDGTHARSIDSQNHPSRNRMKAIWANICGDIPEDWRFSVENLYAKHSIYYTDLENYIYGFAAWDHRNVCLSWGETKEWFQLFNIPTPKEFYRGIYDEKTIKDIWKDAWWDTCEGYVMRMIDEFSYRDFRKSVAKFVRSRHIQTTKHWMVGQEIIPNKLR